MQKLFLTLAVCSLAGLASAQSCSDLTVSGTFASGGSITWDVSGAPANAPTAVLVSINQGSVNVGGLLTIDIGAPLVPVGIGTTDGNGDFSVTVAIPNVPPSAMLDPIDLYSQAVSVDFQPGGGGGMPFTFCKSDVEMITVTL